MRIEEATPVELGWIAGIIDGEGSIGWYPTKKGRVSISIRVNNTDKRIIDEVVRIIGAGSVRFVARERPNHDFWDWVLGDHASVEIVLVRIIPYLIGLKREQAKAIVEKSRARNWRETHGALPSGLRNDTISMYNLNPDMSIRDIGAELGVNAGTVFSWVKKAVPARLRKQRRARISRHKHARVSEI